jgi:hypothetical protein
MKQSSDQSSGDQQDFAEQVGDRACLESMLKNGQRYCKRAPDEDGANDGLPVGRPLHASIMRQWSTVETWQFRSLRDFERNRDVSPTYRPDWGASVIFDGE